MRLGVLDVGSNTVHLLVVDAHRGGHPTPMSSTKAPLRLAEAIDDAVGTGGVRVVVAQTCPREREAAILRTVQEAVSAAVGTA